MNINAIFILIAIIIAIIAQATNTNLVSNTTFLLLLLLALGAYTQNCCRNNCCNVYGQQRSFF
ncbi:MAG: hypothetical protein E7351_04055 [Clostridiales bacterium]|nr:hypothetical protein [Clostridiales bacterium]